LIWGLVLARRARTKTHFEKQASVGFQANLLPTASRMSPYNPACDDGCANLQGWLCRGFPDQAILPKQSAVSLERQKSGLLALLQQHYFLDDLTITWVCFAGADLK
jgi:hypothetical protein